MKSLSILNADGHGKGSFVSILSVYGEMGIVYSRTRKWLTSNEQDHVYVPIHQ